MARRRLVTQHLEDASWKVLEEYPRVVKDMIRGRAGVYALYSEGKLYYVGLASNLMGRLKSHLKDRHNGSWDRFGVYLTVRDDHMKELESLILRIVDPPGNRTGGKFAKSANLSTQLNKRMKDFDADRRALLLGGHVARRRRRTRTAHGVGVKRLAGIVDRKMSLRAWHKGRLFKASLRRDGRVGYRGKAYDSPTAAARAAAGVRCINGWAFWHFRDDKGEWVPMKSMHK